MNITGIVTAILAGLFMGTMGVFSRKTGLDAEVITFFRLLFGAAFLTLLLIFTRRLRVLAVWPTWPVLINGLMLAGFIIFYIQAMYLTSMANAIMVLYLAPLVASVIAHFFLGEKLNLPSALLILTALFGFAMMMEFKIDFSSGTNPSWDLDLPPSDCAAIRRLSLSTEPSAARFMSTPGLFISCLPGLCARCRSLSPIFRQ